MVIWDRQRLDEAFDALPGDGEEFDGTNPWDLACGMGTSRG
jgi:hypothetical protein